LLSRLGPTQLLGGGQSPQVKHVSLHDSAVGTTPVLDQTPVGVDFPVFASLVGSKKQRHVRGILPSLLGSGRDLVCTTRPNPDENR